MIYTLSMNALEILITIISLMYKYNNIIDKYLLGKNA
jgi:hypothetical protein